MDVLSELQQALERIKDDVKKIALRYPGDEELFTVATRLMLFTKVMKDIHDHTMTVVSEKGKSDEEILGEVKIVLEKDRARKVQEADRVCK